MKLSLLLILGLSIQSASAFTLQSSRSSGLKGWSTKTLTFHVNIANCSAPEATLRSALDKAVKIWNGVATANLKLEIGADTTTTAATAFAGDADDTGPVIACATNFRTLTDSSAGVLGVGGIITNSEPRITYGVIVLNSETGTSGNIANTSADELAATVAHEMGHVLGLGHSEDEKALMFYQLKRTQLTLGQDDIDGLTYLYPRNELSGDKPFGCGTISTGTGTSGGGGSGGWMLAAFFLLAWVATNGRRRTA